MTYHDKNRLTAHTAHLKLTATQLAVAKELADSLKLKNGSIQLPASYLAKQIRRTDKTTQLALTELLTLGLFTATKATSHTARTYEMALECPPGCLHLEAHNSPIRLKRLAIRASEAQKLTGNSYPQADQLTGSFAQLTGNHYLTNRDIDIDDIDFQFSKIISTISDLLNDLGQLNAKQLKLKTWITSNPRSVEARIRFLADPDKRAKKNLSPITDLATWVLAIIKNNTETFYSHLEQETTTTKRTIKAQEQTATIYKDLPGSNRLTKARLERYVFETAGKKVSSISLGYLMKRGSNISSKDLQLAEYFEAVATSPNITQIDPNQRLQLELIDGEITASYQDLDGTNFSFELLTDRELYTWGILELSELADHLEAEKQEAELRVRYEASGKSWRTNSDYGLELQAIRAKYPRISPQEARKRYTQVFSQFLNAFYQGLPEQPITPLDTWLPSNYTQLDDYQDLLDHYPENTSPNPWSEPANNLPAYREALGKGYTWDYLAKKMDNHPSHQGTTWAKSPNTWLNDLPELNQQAKARPGERAGEATSLENILGAISRPGAN